MGASEGQIAGRIYPCYSDPPSLTAPYISVTTPCQSLLHLTHYSYPFKGWVHLLNHHNHHCFVKSTSFILRVSYVLLKDHPTRTHCTHYPHAVVPSRSLAGQLQLMSHHADKLVDRLAPYATSGQPVDVWEMLGDMTLAVVGSCAFGIDFDMAMKEHQQGAGGTTAGAAVRPDGGSGGGGTDGTDVMVNVTLDLPALQAMGPQLVRALRTVFEQVGLDVHAMSSRCVLKCTA